MMTKRRAMFATAALGMAGLAQLLAPGSGSAQLMPLFGSHGPRLDGTDFALANEAALTLLEPQPAVLGTIARWSDPASGNHGDLTMGKAYQRDGSDCRTVGWHTVFKAGAERTVQLDTCRIAGVWKLM